MNEKVGNSKQTRFGFLWVWLGGGQFKEGKSVSQVLREKAVVTQLAVMFTAH